MAIALAVIMLAIVAWGVFVEGGATRIIIDGQELTWPFKGAIGAAEMIVASVALFCAAIFLVFVVAGLAFSFWGVLLPQVSSCPGLRCKRRGGPCLQLGGKGEGKGCGEGFLKKCQELRRDLNCFPELNSNRDQMN
jgi:hypothetical protein